MSGSARAHRARPIVVAGSHLHGVKVNMKQSSRINPLKNGGCHGHSILRHDHFKELSSSDGVAPGVGGLLRLGQIRSQGLQNAERKVVK